MYVLREGKICTASVVSSYYVMCLFCVPTGKINTENAKLNGFRMLCYKFQCANFFSFTSMQYTAKKCIQIAYRKTV